MLIAWMYLSFIIVNLGIIVDFILIFWSYLLLAILKRRRRFIFIYFVYVITYTYYIFSFIR